MFTKGNLKLIIKVIQKINNALEIDKLTKNRGKSIESLIRISSSRARLKNKISIDFSDLLYSLIIILKNNLSKKSLSHQKYVYKKLFEYFKDPEINSCLLENIIDEYFINELYQKIDYKFSVNNSNYCVSNMIKERDYNSLDFYNSTCLSSLIKRKRLIKLLANKYHIDIK
uniref:Uncharacterized protein n=1 Tax=Amorphochlora amoebiformis TaxID=1561963 RepID=A0A6T6XL63_9EUKA